MPSGQLSSGPHLGLHTLDVLHQVIGWILIALAIVIVLTAKRSFGDRVFAFALAVLIVVVVLAGCATPAMASTGDPLPVTSYGVGFFVTMLLLAAGGMGLAAVVIWFVSQLFIHVLRLVIPAAFVVGLYLLAASLHAVHP
jgi:hypothetical protein